MQDAPERVHGKRRASALHMRSHQIPTEPVSIEASVATAASIPDRSRDTPFCARTAWADHPTLGQTDPLLGFRTPTPIASSGCDKKCVWPLFAQSLSRWRLGVS